MGTGAPEPSLCWRFISQNCDGLKNKRWKCGDDPSKEEVSFFANALTFYADDFWAIPLAIGATLGGRHVALQEAFGTLVPDHRVDVVVGALPTNQEGVIHKRRGSAKHWRKEERQRDGQNSASTKPTFQQLFADLQVTPCFTRPKSQGAKLFAEAKWEIGLKIKAFYNNFARALYSPIRGRQASCWDQQVKVYSNNSTTLSQPCRWKRNDSCVQQNHPPPPQTVFPFV